MEKYISDNIKEIQISGIRKFYNKVAKVEGAISLTLGQPDFNVPSRVKDAIIEAINNNKTAYTSNEGLFELREEISTYLKGFGINFSPEEICITVGGSEALMSLFTTIINKGDKILLPSPAYPAYESLVKLLGGEVVDYKLSREFAIDFNGLEKILNENDIKAMVLSYPSNPTGAVLSKEERDRLYELLKHRDILVISDEIYSSLSYEEQYFSIAQYEELKEKIVLVSGFSKMFSMTGLRLGFICAPTAMMGHIVKAHQYNVSCAPSIVQYGAVEGLRNSMDDVEEMKNEFKKRRDYVYSRLISMGLKVEKPKGAFYIFPSIEGFNKTSEEFCEELLETQKVAVVPGSAFGSGGENHIRISFCYSIEQLTKALDHLEKYIKTLR